KIHQVWKISVGANKAIDVTMDSTARGPGGTRKAKQLVSSFDLDESRVVASRGGGEALWTFADGALTFVRTLPSGAYRVNIAFAHAADVPTCTVTGAFARENGRGPIQLISPFSGDRVTILSARQLASSCKVSRNAAARSIIAGLPWIGDRRCNAWMPATPLPRWVALKAFSRLNVSLSQVGDIASEIRRALPRR